MERKKFEIHPPKEFQIEKKTFQIELPDNARISEVEPIEGGGIEAISKEDLRQIVEPPLVAACEVLFDKGIKTVFSSANKKDVGGTGHIAIDFDSLSTANQGVAMRIGVEGIIHGAVPKKGIYLEFPITQYSTVGEIREATLALANKFESQFEY